MNQPRQMLGIKGAMAWQKSAMDAMHLRSITTRLARGWRPY